jgi:hypothetical protein
VKEESTLRVFENRLLKKVIGTKKEEVVGGWKRLHSEKLYTLYTWSKFISLIKSRNEVDVACSTHEEW